MLCDTDAAIVRLFRTFPEVDAIEVRVLGPRAPDRVVLAGTVAREDVLAARSLPSPAMRLNAMGVRSHLDLRAQLDHLVGGNPEELRG